MKNFKIVRNLTVKNDRRLAFKRFPTLFNQLRNEKNRIVHRQKSGVYKIPLTNNNTKMDEVYIGVTTRALDKRLTEHRRDVYNGRSQCVHWSITYR